MTLGEPGTPMASGLVLVTRGEAGAWAGLDAPLALWVRSEAGTADSRSSLRNGATYAPGLEPMAAAAAADGLNASWCQLRVSGVPPPWLPWRSRSCDMRRCSSLWSLAWKPSWPHTAAVSAPPDEPGVWLHPSCAEWSIDLRPSGLLPPLLPLPCCSRDRLCRSPIGDGSRLGRPEPAPPQERGLL